MLERDTGHEGLSYTKPVPFGGFLERNIAPSKALIEYAKQDNPVFRNNFFLVFNTVRKTNWNPYIEPVSGIGATGFEQYFAGLPIEPKEIALRIATLGREEMDTVIRNAYDSGITCFSLKMALFEGRVTNINTLLALHERFLILASKCQAYFYTHGIIFPANYQQELQEIRKRGDFQTLDAFLKNSPKDEKAIKTHDEYQEKLKKALGKSSISYGLNSKGEITCSYSLPPPDGISQPRRICVNQTTMDEKLTEGYRFMAQIGKMSHPIVVAALNHIK